MQYIYYTCHTKSTLSLLMHVQYEALPTEQYLDILPAALIQWTCFLPSAAQRGCKEKRLISSHMKTVVVIVLLIYFCELMQDDCWILFYNFI